MNLMTLEKQTDEKLMITWGFLFPRKFSDDLKRYMDRDSIHQYLGGESAEGFSSDTGEEMQKVLVRMLLDRSYRLRPDGTDITDKTKSQFNKYFHNAQGKKDYASVTDHIFHCAKSGNYSYHSFPFTQNIRKKLELLLAYFPAEYRKNYLKQVSALIERHFGSDLLVQEQRYKEELLKAEPLDQLTCLVCIAATWPVWDEDKKQAADLANFLFPSAASADAAPSENAESIIDYVDSEKKRAAARSEQAHQLYDRQDYESAARLFCRITDCRLADDDVLADAYYHCALCILDHRVSVEYGPEKQAGKPRVHAKELLFKAIQLGSSFAVRRYKEEYQQDLEAIPLIRGVSQARKTARIIFNTVNSYTAVLEESLPREMREETDERLVTFAASLSQWEQEIHSIRDFSRDCRFLLFDDDPEKNFRDLLYLLNHLSDLQKTEPPADRADLPLRRYSISVYIRAKEDEYAALIDTALKRLGNDPVRVYILDDHRWAAQYLLYQYPLFRPIQHLTARTLQNTAIPLSFTIISNQNPELACRLVREAFWLGCFHYSKLTLSIHIIGPDAKTVEQRLRFECPGIYGTLPDSDSVSRVVIHKPYEVNSVRSEEMLHAIFERQNAISAYNYYVVNIGNSAENLNFAVKLRELSIRRLIRSGQKPQNSALPTVAFYCPDSNIAHLSEHIVVQNVDSGDQWFNNYNVKPFGMLHDRYSFDALDGGYLERVAQSVHLQYGHIQAHDSRARKLEQLNDYFLRSYNRDSSMAAALSMPYRLFQTEAGDTGHILSADEKARPYQAPDDLNELAALFTANRPASQQNLQMYEHSRWLRWALSRGWEAASSDQVLSYMRAGNLKHQLYIAKLHGCICGFDELTAFSDALYQEAEYSSMPPSQKKRYLNVRESGITAPFDFKAADASGIEATAELITAAFSPETPTEEDPRSSREST